MNGKNDSLQQSRMPAQRGRAIATAVATALCVPGAVFAQNQGSAMQLEEVVVTATRRAESIREVPVSITAFSQAQMDAQGIRQIDDVVRLTPGVQFGRSGGFGSDSGSMISIRGISSGAGGSTTGIYIDDTPIQSRALLASGNFSANAYPQLFDVERVEVLRGPQGTLFGSGSEGGAIRFITPEPSLTKYSAYARSELGFTQYGAPSYEAGIAGGGPLVDGKLGFRASIWTRQDGGYVDRANWYTHEVVDENANRTNSMSARLAFGWSPIENLVITPSVFFQRIKFNDTSAFFLPSDDPAAFQQPLGNVSRHDYVNGHTVRQWADQKLTLPALRIDYQFANMELISNSSYYKRSEEATTDYGFLDFGNWTGGSMLFPDDPSWTAPGYAPQNNKYFTQELRLQSTNDDSPLQWVVGAFYSKNDLDMTLRVNNPHLGYIFQPWLGGACSPDPANPTPGMPDCVAAILGIPLYEGRYPYYGTTELTDKQTALFGQVDYHITDRLIATVGLRWSDMSTDWSNAVAGPINGAPSPRVDAGHSSNTSVTPKYMLSWKTENTLTYASATKGFRNGGVNAPVLNAACGGDLADIGLTAQTMPKSYGPDTVWSYELGSKFTTDGGRLTVDASVYKVDWNDIIRNVNLQCILSFTTNLGKATSQGVDLAVQWQALDNLVLSFNGSYGDVHATQTLPVKDVNGNPMYDSEGRQRLWTRNGASLLGSSVMVSGAAQYSFDVLELPSYARLDYSWQGRERKGDAWHPQSASYAGDGNLFQGPAIQQANLRIGTNLNSWDVSLFINNLTNEQPILGKGRALSMGMARHLLTATTLRPRTIGLTAVYRY